MKQETKSTCLSAFVFTLCLLLATLAAAQTPTLEEECEKKRGTNSFISIFCQSITELEQEVTDLSALALNSELLAARETIARLEGNVTMAKDDIATVEGTLTDLEADLQVITRSAVRGSGTEGFLPFWTGTNTLSDSNIFQNASGRIEIGSSDSPVNSRLSIFTTDVALQVGIKDPQHPQDLGQTIHSVLSKDLLEVGDRNQVRLGFRANPDGGGQTFDFRFFSSMEAIVEDPNNSTKASALRFRTSSSGSGQEQERMRITSEGDVGIGTARPLAKLHVDGGDILVTGGGFVPADYVFNEDYPLMPLSELREFVESQKHLPNIPPGEQWRQEGISVSRFPTRLLGKIEELVLYTLEQQEQIDALKASVQRCQAAH